MVIKDEDTWISLSERDEIYHKDLLKDVLDIANVEKVWIESKINKDYEDIIFFLRRKVNKNKILEIKRKYKYISKIKFLENPKRIIIRSTHQWDKPFFNPATGGYEKAPSIWKYVV